jgi:hypothetical protein
MWPAEDLLDGRPHFYKMNSNACIRKGIRVILILVFREGCCEPLAQSVEHLTFNQGVAGSSPAWLTIRPHGQVVKTPPFHGGNRGSNPLGVTMDG